MRICSQIANIHASAGIESEMISQALLGERVKVLKVADSWSFIELQTDSYNGFVQNHHLVDNTKTSTHRVINKLTPMFVKPDIKSQVKQLAPVASELTLDDCNDDQFLRTDQQLYVWKQHTLAIDSTTDGQLISTAQSLFLGAPYLWGGRSPLGLDCSALVQLTALLHGWQLPRDTSDQVAHFKANSQFSDNGQSQRQSSTALQIDYTQRKTDDLVYWPGHVAIVIDKERVVHATAHSLQCCCEPLSHVEARAGVPESIWRLNR